MKRIICCLLIVVFCVMCCVISVSAADVDEDLIDSAISNQSYRFGDVDCDGVVSSIDTVIIMRCIVGLYDSPYEYRGDVDRDGWVTILDVTQIQRFLADMRPMEYGDCTGIYNGRGKLTVAKDAYDRVTSHFHPWWDGTYASDEAVAGFMTQISDSIDRDVWYEYLSCHESANQIALYFNDGLYIPGYGNGIPNYRMVELMSELSDNKCSLFSCTRAIYKRVGFSVESTDLRIANYYWHFIQDYEK